MNLNALDGELAARGFVLERTRGSHRHYRHLPTRQRLTIALDSRSRTKIEPGHYAAIQRDIARLLRKEGEGA